WCAVWGPAARRVPRSTCGGLLRRRPPREVIPVTAEPPVTYVEMESRRRRRLLLPVAIVLVLLALIGLVVVVLGLVAAMRLSVNRPEPFPDIIAHFEHGSIGADQSSGIPFWVWQALP